MAQTEWEAKPADAKWTDDQWQAIVRSGRDVLVAAAAGSGKTAVLVERIIRKLTRTDEPLDVDRLLVATFTKAAAAEMKQRIREALESRLLLEPEAEHLHRQLALLQRASITTLHSFCTDVIRRHVQQLPIDPSFRVAGEEEAELLRQDAIERVFEVAYSQSEPDSDFWLLADAYGGDRSDESLFRLVLHIHEFSRSHPWPEAWLQEQVTRFTQDDDEGMAAFVQVCKESLLAGAELEVRAACRELGQAVALAGEAGGPAPYLEQLNPEYQQAEALLEAVLSRNWEAVYRQLQGFTFGRLKPCKGDAYDPQMQEQAKVWRNAAKKRLGQLEEAGFGRSPEAFVTEIREMAPMMQALVDLIQQFGEAYSQAKAEKGLVDFGDLEHLCLRVLLDPTAAPGQLVPSEAALAYREQFAEILLDEYQDTNRVQESIVRLIARSQPGNVFMVGDVKQSIYRFRLAEPALFLSKYMQFSSVSDTRSAQEQTAASLEDNGLRIDLARNFRSRQEVINAVNYLFHKVMTPRVGELDYDQRAALVFGAAYPEATYPVELHLIDRQKDEAPPSEDGPVADALEDEKLELETVQLEARWISQRITQLMHGQHPFLVSEKDGKRPLAYRDIVILLRATSNWAPIMLEELKQFGIPAYADTNSGYFQAGEVQTMLALLRIIDNPLQDLALAAVLRSPFVGLSADEMARIRMADRQVPYYEALRTFMSEADDFPDATHTRLAVFLEQLERWRELAQNGPLTELISVIYHDSGYYDTVGTMPGGTQRQANLRALYDRCRQYEATSFRGLFRFLRFVDRMQESGADLGTARALGEQENVVRIMSIHRSKGLEFPVVFVAGLGKGFNLQDLHRPFLLHKELGFGPRYVDTVSRVAYPTLPYLAIRRRMALELLAEEMRVLYVALTRAREKMILVGSAASLDKSMANWREIGADGGALADADLARARCYLDWIGPAWIEHPALWRLQPDDLRETGAAAASTDQSLLSAQRISSSTLMQLQTAAATLLPDEPRMERLRDRLPLEEGQTPADHAISERLSWTYPWQEAQRVLSKASVSEIKRKNQALEQEEAGLVTPLEDLEMHKLQETGTTPLVQRHLTRRPKFMEQQGLTGAERGSALHLLLQHIGLHVEEVTPAHVTEELSRLVARQLMTDEQEASISSEPIVRFFASELGQRLLHAKDVRREVPFHYKLPARELYPDLSILDQESIVVQGIVDCVFTGPKGLVLLDFKTDRGLADSTELLERYRVQMQLYMRAIADIWHQPIAECYLVWMPKGQAIAVHTVQEEKASL